MSATLTQKEATAFAPASVANVAVGFDILGFAFPSLGDRVKVRQLPGELGLVRISPVSGSPDLPLDPKKNTATRGLLRLLKDLNLDFGFQVEIEKGIPIGSGLGGSAASAVAAAVAANALLPQSLSLEELLPYCLDGEEVASGARHGDNIVPSLYGGLQLVRSLDPLDILQVSIPKQLFCVVIHPEAQIETRAARAILKPEIPLKKFVAQSANLAGFIAACYRSDFALMRRSLKDLIIEPQRKSLIPGFDEIQAAALGAGALGSSISGSGPSVFALCEGEACAQEVKNQMVEALQQLGHSSKGAWLGAVSSTGARLL